MKHLNKNVRMLWNGNGGGQMKFKCIYADPLWNFKTYSDTDIRDSLKRIADSILKKRQ